jgi:hypothetical protein
MRISPGRIVNVKGTGTFTKSREIGMNLLDIKHTRSASRFAVIAILVFVAVSFAAMMALQADLANDGVIASLTGYLAQAAEALGW